MQPTSPSEWVDHLFRHESGKMIAVLSSALGLSSIDLVEDVVQDAFVQALQTWRFKGIPPNPSAWLMTTAKNKAIDRLRRKRKWHDIKAQKFVGAKETYELQQLFLDHEIKDSQLAMIFACCHPDLSEQDQIAITLKMVSGFSVPEIARAFLSNPVAIKQRIIRAKRKLKQGSVQLSIPSGSDLDMRLGPVLTVLYLMFNEGFYSSSEEDWMRKDLCVESMRLARLVTEHTSIRSSRSQALLALMTYLSSRFNSRVSPQNQLIPLEDQNRKEWDRGLIRIADHHLSAAAATGEVSHYHIEAAIAAIHVHSPSVEQTDWNRLLILYDVLLTYKPSPIIQLNRSVVRVFLDTPYQELHSEWEKLAEELKDSHLIEMVRAFYYERKGHTAKQLFHLQQALSKTSRKLDQEYIQKKIDKINFSE